MTGLHIFLIVLCFIAACLELRHRLRPSSPLILDTLDWEIKKSIDGIQIIGWLEISNPHKRMEVMVPEIDISPTLLGKEGVNEIIVRSNIQAVHPDEEYRKDGYWQAYIIKSKKSTRAFVSIKLINSESIEAISVVENVWVEINWINYGPFGRIRKRDGIVIPLKRPMPLTADNAYFQQYKDYQLLPLKTHLLGPQDDIVEVLTTYTANIARPGDVLTIGETPIAVMQGRYKHPSTIRPGLIARLLCRAFHPTSSLATACGLQALIDLVGPSRVIISFLIGVGGKFIGIKGLFYRLAGEQARLIDDITGTTPPYDQTIVLGPIAPKEICENISSKLGIDVAIVDVNDLGRVKVLAANKKCNKAFLKKSLRSNPAGNANEQTPIVLVRPN